MISKRLDFNKCSIKATYQFILPNHSNKLPNERVAYVLPCKQNNPGPVALVYSHTACICLAMLDKSTKQLYYLSLVRTYFKEIPCKCCYVDNLLFYFYKTKCKVWTDFKLNAFMYLFIPL